MEFTHEFRIPVPIDKAMGVLTDLERVAPCMPGATLEEVDGDTYSGRVKVKVGPMSLTYSGDATVTEVDEENHTARIEASGREKRGSGTASADVAASLVEDGDETIVTVTTDINITGKPAQFGRGVMADVGGTIIERFATNLQDQLTEEQGADEEEPIEPAAAATGASEDGPRKVEHRAPRDEALDILDVAGDTTIGKIAPIAAGVLLVLLVIWLVTRDGDGEE